MQSPSIHPIHPSICPINPTYQHPLRPPPSSKPEPTNRESSLAVQLSSRLPASRLLPAHTKNPKHPELQLSPPRITSPRTTARRNHPSIRHTRSFLGSLCCIRASPRLTSPSLQGADRHPESLGGKPCKFRLPGAGTLYSLYCLYCPGSSNFSPTPTPTRIIPNPSRPTVFLQLVCTFFFSVLFSYFDPLSLSSSALFLREIHSATYPFCTNIEHITHLLPSSVLLCILLVLLIIFLRFCYNPGPAGLFPFGLFFGVSRFFLSSSL